MEQKIVTGVDSESESISNKEILNEFAKLKNGMDVNIQARLILSITTSLDITEDQYNAMNSELKESHKRAISNLKNFKIFFSEKKSKNRRQNQINKEEMKVFKNSTSTMKYRSLRSKCSLESLVEKCSNNNLKEFSWINQPTTFPTGKKQKQKINNRFNEDDDDEISDSDPCIILFVIGGISYNEIVALEKLQPKLSHKLYIGSNNSFNPNNFIEELSNINNESDNLFNDNESKVHLKNIELEMP